LNWRHDGRAIIQPLAGRVKKKQNGCVNEFLRRAEAEIDSRHLLPRGQKILSPFPAARIRWCFCTFSIC